MSDKVVMLSATSDLPKPKNADLENELGFSLNLPFSMPYLNTDNEKLNEIFQTTLEDEPSIRQMIAMRRRDGQARALYRLIALPIRSAFRGSTFVPAKGGDKESKFIKDMFTLPVQSGGMSTSFSQAMAQMLMGIFDGFAAFEQVYQIPTTGPLKGKITLRKLAHRPAETITFLVDDNGGFAGFRQRIQFKGEAKDLPIPKDRAVYYAANEEERPYYGISYFQSAFYHYTHKVKLLYLAHLSAQHRAVGIRYGHIPKNASSIDIKNFKAMLADFGFAQAGILPPDFTIETTYPSTTVNFLELLNFHNSQMSKSVLAPFFDDAQGGPKSLVDFGKQSDAMFMMMLQTIMDELANIINTYLIPKFIDWNFASDKYPKFTWGTFTNEQKEMINTTFTALSTSGPSMNVSKDFFMELEKKLAEELGLEVDYAAVEAEVAKQKELQDQQFQQQSGDFNNFVTDVNSATGQQLGLPNDGSQLGYSPDGQPVPADQTVAPQDQGATTVTTEVKKPADPNAVPGGWK